MKYFNDCLTLDQAKNKFRKLSKELHPDTSGYSSQSDFVQMYAEFKEVTKILKFKTGKDTDKNFNVDKFADLLRNFDGLKDINISFVGSFIWLEDVVTGAMYQQKDVIKAIKIDGYSFAKWARKKKNWFFSPSEYKQKFGGKKTLEQIKSTYGNNTFTSGGGYKKLA